MKPITRVSHENQTQSIPEATDFRVYESDSPYVSTDADLPISFWPDGELPDPKPADAMMRAQVAVSLHYSAIERERAERREQRAVAFENRDALETIRVKRYVKFSKKEQMNAWLGALAEQNAASRMTPFEQRFFSDMHSRFLKWFPCVKWITQRQYEFLKFLAAKHLALPNREAA